MVEVAFALAIALLVCGVIGSIVPLVPGALLSLAGIYGYWWATGYTEPGAIFLVAATVLGLAAFGLDYLASAISARAGGAGWRTTALAAVVGLVLLVTTGPIGMLVGVAGVVFVMEFERSGDLEASARNALYTALGTLASEAIQVLLTGALLVGFLLAV
ncbi:DUF456 domain-containing protein [Halalkalicoccus subterraneus]|uniref:DUF456 domain-containing protein n=1 Tax=Halalkalicoccus subterraneus TaxID=2675002 RepID=UPI000EFB362A|nr:DUF456 domain-containing protein [Halalkalicoccus subterraneus]